MTRIFGAEVLEFNDGRSGIYGRSSENTKPTCSRAHSVATAWAVEPETDRVERALSRPLRATTGIVPSPSGPLSTHVSIPDTSNLGYNSARAAQARTNTNFLHN